MKWPLVGRYLPPALVPALVLVFFLASQSSRPEAIRPEVGTGADLGQRATGPAAQARLCEPPWASVPGAPHSSTACYRQFAPCEPPWASVPGAPGGPRCSALDGHLAAEGGQNADSWPRAADGTAATAREPSGDDPAPWRIDTHDRRNQGGSSGRDSTAVDSTAAIDEIISIRQRLGGGLAQTIEAIDQSVGRTGLDSWPPIPSDRSTADAMFAAALSAICAEQATLGEVSSSPDRAGKCCQCEHPSGAAAWLEHLSSPDAADAWPVAVAAVRLPDGGGGRLVDLLYETSMELDMHSHQLEKQGNWPAADRQRELAHRLRLVARDHLRGGDR